MLRLRFHQAQLARDIARNAWLDSSGDRDQAIEIARFKLRERSVGLSPIVIEAIILLIIKLIDHWIETQQAIPSIVMSSTEPGFGVGEYDD
jgi:hypothetical protein